MKLGEVAKQTSALAKTLRGVAAVAIVKRPDGTFAVRRFDPDNPLDKALVFGRKVGR